MKTALLNNHKIQVDLSHLPTKEFTEMLEVVHQIPDRHFNKGLSVWEVPSTPWHSAEIVRRLKPLGFFIDPVIVKNANGHGERPRLNKLPEGLYDYQRQGVEFIHGTRGRAVVGDDMGLGKTAMSLVFVDQFAKKTLVVAPANVLFKWALKEVPMWTKGKTVQVVTTGKQEMDDRDITIMSYGIMVSRYEQLQTIPFDAIVFDEAHYLKNYKAQRTRVAKKLVKGVPYLLFLSGTPFMNRRMEMFPLLNMLDPRAWPNAIQFGIRYAGGVFQHGHWVQPPDRATNTDELKDRLSRIMLRRTKKEVAHQLPDLTRTSVPVEIEMTDYRALKKEVKERAKRVKKYNGAAALALLNVLRQETGRKKVAAALELAEDVLESGNQVVLFAHHIEVVKMLMDGLIGAGVMIGVIDGSTKAQDRQDRINLFLGGNLQAMIITTAGAEGIDLYTASNIIFVEREWNPAKEEQAESRLHRNGQKSAVTAYYLIAKDTVDEKLDDTVRRKRDEFSELIETDIIHEVYLDLFE